jgi:spore germination protein YaaH
MSRMIDQFNRINRSFGANRMELIEATEDTILFRILNWGVFLIGSDGAVYEVTLIEFRYCNFTETGKHLFQSDRSNWLQSVSLGRKRDESGSIIIN